MISFFSRAVIVLHCMYNRYKHQQFLCSLQCSRSSSSAGSFGLVFGWMCGSSKVTETPSPASSAPAAPPPQEHGKNCSSLERAFRLGLRGLCSDACWEVQSCLSPVHDALQDGGEGRDADAGPDQDGVLGGKDLPGGRPVRPVHVALSSKGRGGVFTREPQRSEVAKTDRKHYYSFINSAQYFT